MNQKHMSRWLALLLVLALCLSLGAAALADEEPSTAEEEAAETSEDEDADIQETASEADEETEDAEEIEETEDADESGSTSEDGAITATSTFNLTSMLSSIYVASSDSGIATVSGDEAVTETNNTTTVAQVGNTGYATLAAAIAAATDGGTVTLLADISETNSVAVSGNITLDLNGKTLTVSTSSGALYVTGSLTIQDSASSGTIKNDSGYGIYVDGGTVVMDSGTIESKYAAISCNNTTGEMNVTINGGTVKSTTCEAIYMPNQLTLTINGGSIIGGISLRMGQVTINGGTVTGIVNSSNKDAIENYWNYQGSVWLGDAIFVMAGTYMSSNSTYGNSCSITVGSGATIDGNIVIYEIGNNYDQSVSVTAPCKLVKEVSAIEISDDCASASTHTVTVTKNLTHNYTSEVTTAATCTTAGVTTYTCTNCDATYTEEIAATGHKWGDPTWEWSDSYSEATATFTCENDGSHVETVTAKVTSEVTVEATSTTEGTGEYTATVTFKDTTYTDTQTVTIPATGDEGNVSVTSEDNVVKTTVEVNKADLLNKHDEEVIAAGGSVEFALDVTDVNETNANVAKEIAAIDACAEDLSGEVVSAYYLEIDLTKYVTDANGGTDNGTPITDANVELTITVEIPKKLLAEVADSGLDGTYTVIRYHDGAAATLSTTYDANNNTVTFKTDKFSTYAIVYTAAEETPVVSPSTSPDGSGGGSSGNGGSGSSSKPSSSNSPTSAKTGDKSNAALWAVLLVCGAFGLGITAIAYGKRQKNK